MDQGPIVVITGFARALENVSTLKSFLPSTQVHVKMVNSITVCHLISLSNISFGNVNYLKDKELVLICSVSERAFIKLVVEK